MGRGRQKAKQTKIARKLKYLTTDTDYNQLQKELASRGSDGQRTDSYVNADDQFDTQESVGAEQSDITPNAAEMNSAKPSVDNDLDDYARWAAEAAAKATSGEIPVVKPRRKPIPIPVPSVIKQKHAANAGSQPNEDKESDTGAAVSDEESVVDRKKKTSTAKSAVEKPASVAKKTVKTTAKKAAAVKKTTSAAKKASKSVKTVEK